MYKTNDTGENLAHFHSHIHIKCYNSHKSSLKFVVFHFHFRHTFQKYTRPETICKWFCTPRSLYLYRLFYFVRFIYFFLHFSNKCSTLWKWSIENSFRDDSNIRWINYRRMFISIKFLLRNLRKFLLKDTLKKC